MDRISPSEGDDAGSIPAEGTDVELWYSKNVGSPARHSFSERGNHILIFWEEKFLII